MDQQKIAMEQQFIKEKLPDQVMFIELNASDARKSARTTEGRQFISLLESLGMAEPLIPQQYSHLPFTSSSSTSSPIVLNLPEEWKDKNKELDESAAYEPLVDALVARGHYAVNVSAGQYLPDSLLFHESVWTLRKKDISGLNQSVVLIGRIQGRVDIVVLNTPLDSVHILRHMVRYALEIKRPFDMNTDCKEQSCVREATAQVIGLCAHNTNNSPSVILTDLLTHFYVISLTIQHGRDKELSYKIVVNRFANLDSCIEVAIANSAECISTNFGRQPSANVSEISVHVGDTGSSDVMSDNF